MSFSGKRSGYLVIERFGDVAQRSGFLLRTRDGGATWYPQFVVSTPIAGAGVAAASGGTDYLLGGPSSLLASTTGGDAGTRSALTATTARRSLRRAGRITVTGRLTPAAGNERVTVSHRAAGSTRWRAQTVKVAANGAYTTSWDVRRGTSRFVAQWAGDFRSAGDGSPVLSVRVGGDDQPSPRADRRHLPDLQRRVARQVEPEALEDARGDDADLGLAEAHSQARPRPASERHVGALGDALAVARGEALGAEGLGLVPHVGQAVARPGAVVDGHAAGHGDAGDHRGSDRAARSDPGGGVQAQRLVHGQVEVERFVVDQLRVARELVEEEGDGRGRGVVAGEQQRHDLVAHVAVRQRLAGLVARVQEQAEDVLAAGAARPAVGDLAKDQAVEAAAGLPHARPRRARPAQHLQRVVARVEAQRGLELGGGVQASRPRAIGVQPEQRAHGDAQRQLARPRVEVEGLTGAHAREGGVRLGLHGRVGGFDALAVEGGQHDPARAAVEVAVDGEQPVAQQWHQVAHAPVAPRVVGRVGDGDVVVGLGPQREDVVAVEDPRGEDRAEPLVEVEQQRQRVAREALRAGQARARLARREGDGRLALRAQVAGQAHERVGRDGGGAGERHASPPSLPPAGAVRPRTCT